MKLKSRYRLKKNEARKLRERLEDTLGIKIEGSLETATTETGIEIILVDGAPLLFRVEGEVFPTVRGALEFKPERKRVVVDSGAVRPVAGGADVMGPGITRADPEIMEGDLVVVVEETHQRPLAVGRALRAGVEMKERGKAVENLHHVGDKLWNL